MVIHILFLLSHTLTNPSPHLDLEKLGNPGWNWKNYIRRVREVEGWASVVY